MFNIKQKISGFTLLEVTVVLLIMGLIFSFALLSISNAQQNPALESAKQLANEIRQMQDIALLQQEPIALSLTSKSYSFYKISPASFFSEKVEKVIFEKKLPDSLEILQYNLLPFTKGNKMPDIVFFPTGEATPVSLSFIFQNELFLKIEIQATGNILIDSPQNSDNNS